MPGNTSAGKPLKGPLGEGRKNEEKRQAKGGFEISLPENFLSGTTGMSAGYVPGG